MANITKIEMSHDIILKYLEILNQKLEKKNISGEIFMVGGAVMCLAFKSRYSTFDIDAVFIPADEIQACVFEISREYNIQPLWLNDIVYQYFSDKGIFNEYINYSHLKIFVAAPEYMLALKCLSARLGNANELSDIKFLISHLGLKTKEDVYQTITEFYSLDEFQARLDVLLNEILSK